jgi:hypothetical protein
MQSDTSTRKSGAGTHHRSAAAATRGEYGGAELRRGRDGVGAAVSTARMSRQEYVSPEGLRLDGRRPGEVRRVRCSLGVLARADGSAMYEQGNTRVMAAVYGPREVTNRMDALPDRAIINAELSNASFSASERKGKLKHDRRANELALLVQEAFEAAILVQLFPNSQIDIFLQIMQVDGGTRAARDRSCRCSCSSARALG